MNDYFKTAIETALVASNGKPATFKRMACKATGLTASGFMNCSVTSAVYKALKSGKSMNEAIDLIWSN